MRKEFATILGKNALRQAGFGQRTAFVRHLLETIKNIPHKTALPF
jgi:hypothetical protein